MEPNLRQTYLSELLERIEDFSAIWPRFVEECAAFDKPGIPAKDALINRWRVRKYAADLLLTAAQIGRILDPHPWGSEEFKAACRARGEALRSGLGVPPDSPLLDNDLRNALEHIDEYIDCWVAGNPNRPLNTWAFTTTAPGEAPLENAIRRIHVRTYDVFVLDQRANLRVVYEAVQALAKSLPVVHRSEMVIRFDDPESGESDVITVRRVHNANEPAPPTDDPPRS